jgi:hypothetical protein
VFKYQAAAYYPVQERARLVAGVDVEDCIRGDPQNLILRGVLTPQLLIALSKSLNYGRRLMLERAEIFALLLLLADFMFQRKTAAPCGGSDSETASSASGRRPLRQYAFEYVVPSLVSPACPAPVLARFWSLFDAGSLLIGRRVCTRARRRVAMRQCSDDIFSVLVCRLGPLITPESRIFADAVWIQDKGRIDECVAPPPDGCCDELLTRALVHFVREAADGAVEIIFFSTEVEIIFASFVVQVTKTVRSLMKHRYPGVAFTITAEEHAAAPEDARHHSLGTSWEELDRLLSE